MAVTIHGEHPGSCELPPREVAVNRHSGCFSATSAGYDVWLPLGASPGSEGHCLGDKRSEAMHRREAVHVTCEGDTE